MAATNPLQGEIAFSIEDGREFVAVFDIPAIVALEDMFDRPSVQIAAQIAQGRVGYVRAGMLAGLRRRYPDLTLEEIDKIIATIVGEKRAAMIILDGISHAFPKPKKSIEGDPLPQ